VGSYAIVPRTIDPTASSEITVAAEHRDLDHCSGRYHFGVSPRKSSRRVIGTGDAGLTYTVQATSDLVTWQVIGTATADANRVLVFEDADAGSFTARFYRAVLP